MQLDDPRLDCAILRPMESDGDHFLAYYLTQTDEAAISFKASRSNPPKSGSTNADPLAFLDADDKPDPDADADADPNATAFHFVRDYETVKVEQEVPNEFLLVIDDGGAKVDGGVKVEDVKVDAGGRERRGKGAYYKNIERKMILKKKRVNVRPLSPLLSYLFYFYGSC
jgi:RNA polymerase II-associated factor 1